MASTRGRRDMLKPDHAHSPNPHRCVGLPTWQEVRKVIDYRVKELGPEGGKVLAVCLSSRRNMCIHERVMEEVRAPTARPARLEVVDRSSI